MAMIGPGRPERQAPSAAGSWSGSAVLAPGLVLYAGPGGTAADHAHHAIQMFWALDGQLELDVGGQAVTTTSALIPAGQRHGVRAVTGRIVLALLEPQGPRGQALARRVAGAGPGAVASAGPVPPPDGDLGPEALTAWFDGALARLGWHEEPTAQSRHVQRALDYVDANLDGMPRLADAAAAAHVSPSRLTHSFTEETGIPFRRYVLWARLRRAVQEVGGGANLTEAAVRAGFSDSAHLSRTFRANFGLPPSLLAAGIAFAGTFDRP
ncbi:MAG: AraC family transcriptional regulator [Mycobacteriales bacterium]|nr:AraC family transcriptional regulator [Mycobacteriales bacterium]